jgi:putative oxidoreductase
MRAIGPTNGGGIMSNQNDVLCLVGRILLALMFLVGGIDKIMGFDGNVKYAQTNGVPMANIAVYVAIAIELGMGLLLVAGFQTRLAAIVLTIFILSTLFFFHQYWNMEGGPRGINRVIFFKNVAVIGGMLMLMVAGPGRYSVDARR